MLAAARLGIRKNSVVPPFFSDNFNRSNRVLNGDNGWGGSGWSITGNQAVSSGNGDPLYHLDSGGSIIDLTYTHQRPSSTGFFYTGLGSTAGLFGAGVYFRYNGNSGDFTVFDKDANVLTSTFVSTWAGMVSGYTVVRFTVNKSTGAWAAYQGGLLRYTGTLAGGTTYSTRVYFQAGTSGEVVDDVSIA